MTGNSHNVGTSRSVVILDPVDGTVDNGVVVTVQVLDQYGNIVLAEQRDINIVTSSNTAPGGRVNIVNGTHITPVLTPSVRPRLTSSFSCRPRADYHPRHQA